MCTCMLMAVGVVCTNSNTMKNSGSGAAKMCHRCAKSTIPVPVCNNQSVRALHKDRVDPFGIIKLVESSG